MRVCVICLFLWEHRSDFNTKNQVYSGFWVSWCDHTTRNLSLCLPDAKWTSIVQICSGRGGVLCSNFKMHPHQYILHQQNMLGWKESAGNYGLILLKLTVQQSSVLWTGHIWISQVPLCTYIIKILTENTVKGNMAHWPHTVALLSNSYLWAIPREPFTEPV